MEQMQTRADCAQFAEKASREKTVPIAHIEAILKDVLAVGNEEGEGLFAAVGPPACTAQNTLAIEIEYRLHAYMRVAAKRFIDVVLMSIRSTLLKPLKNAIQRWRKTCCLPLRV